MDKYSLLNTTACIGIFVVLFLALFLLTVKTKHKLGNWLFAFFLIANAIDASKYLIHHIPENLINLEAFRWSIVYLVPASFYLYAMSVCFYDFRLKKKHLLHVIPFVAYNLYLASGIYFGNTATKIEFIKGMNQMPLNQFFQFLFEFLFQVYFIASFLIIRKSKTVYLENYTNPNISLINALNKITIIYYLLHFLVLLRWLVTFIFGLGDLRAWIVTLDGFSFLFCTCWYLYIALNNPEFFRGVNSELKPIADIIPKQKSSAVINDEKSKQIEFLKDFMISKEPYLDSSLTIQDLAEQVKMPVKDLSALINLYMNKHFFDFINEYRIEKAKEILKDSSQKKLTILEILYQVGFNSKSSFSTSFKKHTGKTPTDFRKNSN
ncbi:AraC family transcriptional regulator [Elizabethkingia meningoseptica]|jgi:AraC-like DNA-binding protein|uniref:helix-turn-helix domain-containing protein n=1 Tax=Elizabethkingia TaxID=308865 RepID=UPI000332C070|nr:MULTISPECIES: helix-turn-helix domain-containing protein [Elizabethkingia]AQX05291.1 AraC family transcriptional regulator [Elizabethkingia meningoseptica]AQX47334.1 AraC family transcriptional regulator [Elizabethkingia meningoseptica]AQX90619.1 AraC family transcriptional regulator [Elizabethkingia anophelis]EHM7981770.1 helix-turn-helix domain-containing protein [Elizabethkingia anophelis]EHM8032268.1 helix-turn-helix domain-containing protein [Elizabethkingia anophelis]